MINSYPSIYNLGHAAIAELLKGPVIVEEKVDGSQFSFWKQADGTVECRSKGAQINMLAPEGMFKTAIESIQKIAHLLRPGWTYRGEYLANPHHNALTYDRVPAMNIVIFDICPGNEQYLAPHDKRTEAISLGLECVPVLYQGIVADVEQFRKLLDTPSILGGQKVEGVVIKPQGYDLFGRDKKVLMGKFVAEAYREVHARTWDSEHKTKGPDQIIEALQFKYGTAARWGKALIHLRERGEIENDPRDIGKLMKEVPCDVEKECREQIMADLYDWAWPQLRRRVGRGLPEWYKDQLLKRQFEPENSTEAGKESSK